MAVGTDLGVAADAGMGDMRAAVDILAAMSGAW